MLSFADYNSKPCFVSDVHTVTETYIQPATLLLQTQQKEGPLVSERLNEVTGHFTQEVGLVLEGERDVWSQKKRAGQPSRQEIRHTQWVVAGA